ncbi:hypothetical protein WH43_13730 [Rheinheimera sp. KL1]|uniref:DUF3135 domain-containing protein n=1 Tax=Rheinheimera sp. KL1 TaxID=1635005 RepID=UPI0006A9923E|nr:DUF3135 domain-containing protein [Rheinheimera sp. KL1]KOO57568.1 hypothetical protein WH43_13730 [Rheinheimera sp. KL1]
MTQNYPSLPDFDELMRLAKVDPERLNDLQRQINEQCVSQASHQRSAWKLQKLIMQISKIKKSYQHPLLVCDQLYVLLLDVILLERDAQASNLVGKSAGSLVCAKSNVISIQ